MAKISNYAIIVGSHLFQRQKYCSRVQKVLTVFLELIRVNYRHCLHG